MSITKEELIKLSNLAMLDLSLDSSDPKFETQLIDNLNNILHLVEQLQNIDTTNIPPMVHPEENANQRLREDVVTENNIREEIQNIAPNNAIESGLYLVPKVIETC